MRQGDFWEILWVDLLSEIGGIFMIFLLPSFLVIQLCCSEAVKVLSCSVAEGFG